MARIDQYPNIPANTNVELSAWENNELLPKGGRVVNITIPDLVAFLNANLTLSASQILYTNIAYPSIQTLSDALDFLLSGVVPPTADHVVFAETVGADRLIWVDENTKVWTFGEV